MSQREAFENKVKLDKGVYWCDSANCYMRDAGGGFTVSDRTANDKWEGWKAATEQHTPKGWTLVPIEPTDEMKSAIRNSVDSAYLALVEGIGGEASDWALQSYRAALLATKQPKD